MNIAAATTSPMDLDRTDFEIIRLLQENARISNKELAQQNGIAPSTCHERVRRLSESGILRKFSTEVSPSALGIGVQAMVTLRLKQHDDLTFAALFKELSSREEVINAYLLASTNEFLVHVAVRDVEHLRSLVLDSYAARPDVTNIETSLIFDFHHRPRLPNYKLVNGESESITSGGYI